MISKRQIMTKGLKTVTSICQDTTEVQFTRPKLCILPNVLIHTMQTENFGQYVLNFIFVGMIQNVILFYAFHGSLSKEEI